MGTVSKLLLGYVVVAGALVLVLEREGTATTSRWGDVDVEAAGGTGGFAGTGGMAGRGGTGGTGGVAGMGGGAGVGGRGGTGGSGGR